MIAKALSTLVAVLVLMTFSMSSASAQIIPNPGYILDLINQMEEKEKIDDSDDTDDDTQVCADEPADDDDGWGTVDAIIDGCYNIYQIWKIFRPSNNDNEQRGFGDVQYGVLDTAKVTCQTSNGYHPLFNYLYQHAAANGRDPANLVVTNTIFNGTYKNVYVGAVQNDNTSVLKNVGIEYLIDPVWGVTDAEKRTPAYQRALRNARAACDNHAAALIQ